VGVDAAWWKISADSIAVASLIVSLFPLIAMQTIQNI